MIRDKWLNADATVAIPGIELIENIDRVLISSPGNLVSTGRHSVEAPMLFAVQGHFDGPKLHQFFTRLGAKPQSYNSFQVYRPQEKGAKDMAYVQFDARRFFSETRRPFLPCWNGTACTPPAPEPVDPSWRARPIWTRLRFLDGHEHAGHHVKRLAGGPVP